MKLFIKLDESENWPAEMRGKTVESEIETLAFRHCLRKDCEMGFSEYVSGNMLNHLSVVEDPNGPKNAEPEKEPQFVGDSSSLIASIGARPAKVTIEF